MINSVAEDFKKRLREHPLDEQLFSGTNKFIDRYNRYSCKSNAMLASTLHKFAWVLEDLLHHKCLEHYVMENELLFKPQLLADAEKE